MSRSVNWIGTAIAVLFVVVVAFVLYGQGLAADRNPGGDLSIDRTLWLLGIGLMIIIASTITVSRLVGRRSR